MPPRFPKPDPSAPVPAINLLRFRGVFRKENAYLRHIEWLPGTWPSIRIEQVVSNASHFYTIRVCPFCLGHPIVVGRPYWIHCGDCDLRSKQVDNTQVQVLPLELGTSACATFDLTTGTPVGIRHTHLFSKRALAAMQLEVDTTLT